MFEKHNKIVKNLWEDLEKRQNKRIPILFSFDEQFRLPLYGCKFIEYYNNPILQVEVQLKTEKWIRENIVQDGEMGIPEEYWVVVPKLWMDEREFFGCEIMEQENDYAWSKPISAEKENLLKMLKEIDTLEKVRNSKLYKFYTIIKEEVEIKNKTFCDRPVKVGFPGNSTLGIFTTAAAIRGHEKFFVDMYENPDFVIQLLEIITDKTIDRIKSWHKLAGTNKDFPLKEPWSMCDDTLQMISEEMYGKFVLYFHKKIYDAITSGIRGIHLCGHSQQHFKTLYQELDIKEFDGPGPHIDLAKMRQDLGDDVKINAQVHHTILNKGSLLEIEKMVKEILLSGVKKGGYMQLLGYVINGTPMENLKTMYEAGLKYGQIQE